MHYWVGITDRDWFENLRRLKPDEVNFWQPSARAPRKMDAGWPFLFKLHSPLNYVVGGGFFVRFTTLPCFLAWNAFREKNGASSLAELVQRVARYRKAPQTPGTAIGCNVLTDPFFFSKRMNGFPYPPTGRPTWCADARTTPTTHPVTRYGKPWKTVS